MIMQPVPGIFRGACNTFLELEVAVGYDTTFCNDDFGGKSQSDSHVQSLLLRLCMYEKPDMCIELVLTDVEGYCDADGNEWRDMILLENSGCGRTYAYVLILTEFFSNAVTSVTF
jgi:hypothetical protein